MYSKIRFGNMILVDFFCIFDIIKRFDNIKFAIYVSSDNLDLWYNTTNIDLCLILTSLQIDYKYNNISSFVIIVFIINKYNC